MTFSFNYESLKVITDLTNSYCNLGNGIYEYWLGASFRFVGLNNDYQIECATHYAAIEGLSNKLGFVKGDFISVLFLTSLMTKKISC